MNTGNTYDDMDTGKGNAGMGGMDTPGQSGSPDEMPETTSNPSRKADEQMGR